MATIIRVKRHRAEDPASALVIACKRLKQSEDLNEIPTLVEEKNLLNFAGTVSSKTEPVTHVVQKVLSQVTQNRNPKSRTIDIQNKLRSENKIIADRSRCKLINAFRGIDFAELEDTAKERDAAEAEAKLLYDVYDVIEENIEKQGELEKEGKDKLDEITCNGVPLIRHVLPQTDKQETDFVYDLYMTKGVSFDEVLQQSISIEKYLDPLVNYKSEDIEDCPLDDDEDSNDENYYKNEYPEEDSDFENDVDVWGDYDDKRMVQHFSNCRIDTNSDEESFVADVGPSDEDIWTHGSAYARYRVQKMNEL